MGTGPFDPKSEAIKQAEKTVSDTSAGHDNRVLIGTLYRQGRVPTGYKSATEPCGHHPGNTSIDLQIQGAVYYDVSFPSTASSEKGNTFKDEATFEITFPGGRESLAPSIDLSLELTARLMPDSVADNVQAEVSLPGSFGSDIKKVFTMNTNQSFTENIGNLALNCPAAPKSLSEAVERLQRSAAEKRVILPDAYNIKQKRGEGGKVVSANPRIEIVGGESTEVRITSEGNKGIALDHGDVILSGNVGIDDAYPTAKHQGTGLGIEKVDNPPIQGPIVAPHPKFLPDLSFIAAIAPAALAISLVFDLVKHGSELE